MFRLGHDTRLPKDKARNSREGSSKQEVRERGSSSRKGVGDMVKQGFQDVGGGKKDTTYRMENAYYDGKYYIPHQYYTDAGNPIIGDKSRSKADLIRYTKTQPPMEAADLARLNTIAEIRDEVRSKPQSKKEWEAEVRSVLEVENIRLKNTRELLKADRLLNQGDRHEAYAYLTGKTDEREPSFMSDPGRFGHEPPFMYQPDKIRLKADEIRSSAYQAMSAIDHSIVEASNTMPNDEYSRTEYLRAKSSTIENYYGIREANSDPNKFTATGKPNPDYNCHSYVLTEGRAGFVDAAHIPTIMQDNNWTLIAKKASVLSPIQYFGNPEKEDVILYNKADGYSMSEKISHSAYFRKFNKNGSLRVRDSFGGGGKADHDIDTLPSIAYDNWEMYRANSRLLKTKEQLDSANEQLYPTNPPFSSANEQLYPINQPFSSANEQLYPINPQFNSAYEQFEDELI